MTDFTDVSPATRRVMQANKGKDTKPEMIVRRLVHGMGYRYRLHRKDLPGRPDLVFGPRKKVIFVHGCFWHAHDEVGCRLCARPKTRSDYWTEKFARNKRRDANVIDALVDAGWRVLVVWECRVSQRQALANLLRDFLDAERPQSGVMNGVSPRVLALPDGTGSGEVAPVET